MVLILKRIFGKKFGVMCWEGMMIVGIVLRRSVIGILMSK